MKYELTKIKGSVLYQIQALIDIPNVCKKGDLGGFDDPDLNKIIEQKLKK